MSIANRVYELRKKKNLSQSELAKEAGISPAYVGKIEKGNAKPTGDVLSGLAEALDTTIEFLLNGHNSKVINYIVPKKFVVADEARLYIERHKKIASEDFDVSKLSDQEALKMANQILDFIETVSYKYKK
jgi:transcriptional regulator with XRE-family HTH domain